MSWLSRRIKGVARGAATLVTNPKRQIRNIASDVGKAARAVAPVAGFIPGVGPLAAGALAVGGAALGAATRRRPAASPAPATAPPSAAAPGADNPTDRISIAPRPADVPASSPMAGTSAIVPGQGLRGRRIDAVAPDREPMRLRGEREYRDAVGPTDLQAGAMVLPTQSARAAAMRDRVDRAAGALETGPDRVAMARTALADFDTELEEGRTAGMREISRSAAAFGRVGSGVNNGRLAELERRVQGDRSREVNRLVADLTERDAADRFTKLNAFQGLTQDERAADAADRMELRGEREWRNRIDEGNLTRRMAVGERALSRGDDRADEAVGDALRTRDQLVSERGYEDDLAGEAFARRLQEEQLAMDREQTDFQRGVTLDRLGNEGDPTGLELGVADRRSGRAGELLSGAAGLLGQRAFEEQVNPQTMDVTAADVPRVLPTRSTGALATATPSITGPVRTDGLRTVRPTSSMVVARRGRASRGRLG